MKKVLIVLATFFVATNAFAQESMPVRGEGPQVTKVTEERPGVLVVEYTSDEFPVTFEVNGKVVEVVETPEAGSIGFEAIQCPYQDLPNGGRRYALHVTSKLGATYVSKQKGT